MANRLYDENSIQNIAVAIRSVNGSEDTYSVSEMPNAIIQAAALLAGRLEPVEHSWNQMNDVAKGFIENVTYNPSDYTASSIASYANQATSYAKSKPFGYTVNLPSGELEIIDTTNGGVMRKTITEGDYTFYNIAPNSHSYYIVRNNGEIVQLGQLTPTGVLRMIHNEAELFRNCRDLGGWACDGGIVKYGLLFRGNEPYGKITENDKAMWTGLLNLKKEINLQSAAEIGDRTESGFGESVEMYHIDITYGTLADWKTGGKTKAVLDELFDYIIDGLPTFYHCTAGADRTGYLSLLISAILGVSQSDLDKDYELTCFSTGADTDTNARRRNEADWTSRIDYLNTFSGDTFRDRVVNYLVQCGISIDKINAFRVAMIDGTPETLTADVDTFPVTKTLDNATIDNTADTVVEYQPYIAEITPNGGYIIESITVTMGGENITDKVISGAYASLGALDITENGTHDVKNYESVNVDIEAGISATRHAITQTLNGATSNNTQTEIVDGQSYGAIITSNDNFGIDNVTVTMDGVDVSSSVICKEVE